MGAILVAGITIMAMKGFGNRFDYAKQEVAEVASNYPDHQAAKTVRAGTCFLTPGSRARAILLPNALGSPQADLRRIRSSFGEILMQRICTTA